MPRIFLLVFLLGFSTASFSASLPRFCDTLVNVPIQKITREQEQSLFQHYKLIVSLSDFAAKNPKNNLGISAEGQYEYQRKIERKIFEQYEPSIYAYIHDVRKYRVSGERRNRLYSAAMLILQRSIRSYRPKEARFYTYFKGGLDRNLYKEALGLKNQGSRWSFWTDGERARLKEYDSHSVKLANKLKRKPNESEVMDSYLKESQVMSRKNMELILDRRRFWKTNSGPEWEGLIKSRRVKDGLVSSINQEMFKALAMAKWKLSYRERKILDLVYEDEWSFKKIGARFEVSASRVGQIRNRSLEKMREYMESQGFFDLDHYK